MQSQGSFSFSNQTFTGNGWNASTVRKMTLRRKWKIIREQQNMILFAQFDFSQNWNNSDVKKNPRRD